MIKNTRRHSVTCLPCQSFSSTWAGRQRTPALWCHKQAQFPWHLCSRLMWCCWTSPGQQCPLHPKGEQNITCKSDTQWADRAGLAVQRYCTFSPGPHASHKSGVLVAEERTGTQQDSGKVRRGKWQSEAPREENQRGPDPEQTWHTMAWKLAHGEEQRWCKGEQSVKEQDSCDRSERQGNPHISPLTHPPTENVSGLNKSSPSFNWCLLTLWTEGISFHNKAVRSA